MGLGEEMKKNERTQEMEVSVPKSHFPEPFAAGGVRESREHRRAQKSGASPEKGTPYEARPAKKSGRPHDRWRIRVVRVDAATHPKFLSQRTNPFAAMDAQARVAEIDGFCARLWARTKKKVA